MTGVIPISGSQAEYQMSHTTGSLRLTKTMTTVIIIINWTPKVPHFFFLITFVGSWYDRWVVAGSSRLWMIEPFPIRSVPLPPHNALSENSWLGFSLLIFDNFGLHSKILDHWPLKMGKTVCFIYFEEEKGSALKSNIFHFSLFFIGNLLETLPFFFFDQLK